jgi:hypothetical protein
MLHDGLDLIILCTALSKFEPLNKLLPEAEALEIEAQGERRDSVA